MCIVGYLFIITSHQCCNAVLQWVGHQWSDFWSATRVSVYIHLPPPNFFIPSFRPWNSPRLQQLLPSLRGSSGDSENRLGRRMQEGEITALYTASPPMNIAWPCPHNTLESQPPLIFESLIIHLIKICFCLLPPVRSPLSATQSATRSRTERWWQVKRGRRDF